MILEINNNIISPDDLCNRVKANMDKVGIVSNIERTQQMSYASEINWNIIDQSLTSLMDNIKQMNETWILNDQYIMSNRKFIGRLVVLIKRCVRKSISWFIFPYVRQQTAFNGAVTRAICDMQKIQQQMINGLTKK